jgi:hypothetical protein
MRGTGRISVMPGSAPLRHRRAAGPLHPTMPAARSIAGPDPGGRLASVDVRTSSGRGREGRGRRRNRYPFGHLLHIQRPQPVAQAMAEFLAWNPMTGT